MFAFALDDWIPLHIGGSMEYYVRPGRPYTIVVNRDDCKVVLTAERASNSSWYFVEYRKILAKGGALSLNQENIYLLEMRAMLSEVNKIHLPNKHFYQNPFDLFNVEVLYHSIFQVTWEDSGIRRVGWLGVRNRPEYLQVLNAIKHLQMESSSLEHMKASNIVLSLTGVLATEVVEVGHNRGGQYYVWETPNKTTTDTAGEEAGFFPASASCSCGKSVFFMTGECDPAGFMNSAEGAWSQHKESCSSPISV